MKQFRLSTVSDIHLGNRRNGTESIIANLDKYFSCDEHLSTVDMIVFVGDVFDEPLPLSSDDVSHIDAWIARTLRLCFKYNVLVRVLEGTPSHDRNQSNRFNIINEIHYLNNGMVVDLKYVKTLSIEHIDRFDIDVLYVPDEWSHTTDETLVEVKSLLKSKDMTKIDFAFMHGAFHYQLGSVVKDHIKHKEVEYLDIVRSLIFVGHIHKYSNFDRIYAQGSFDRLAHGEEELKGFLSTIINADNTFEVKFIENKGSRKFITVSCRYDDIEDNLKKIDKVVKKLLPQSFVRIEAEYSNPISNSIDVLKRRWPLLNWSILPKDKQADEEKNVFSEEYVYSPIIINKETILSLVMGRISKLNIQPDILDRCILHLKELS